VKAAPIHPAMIERLVFTKTLCYWFTSAARAPLKDGQNIKRNKDQTIAIISELWLATLLWAYSPAALAGWK